MWQKGRPRKDLNKECLSLYPAPISGELSTYTANVSGSPVFSTTYTREKLGRITQRIETLGAVTTTFDYVYDLAGRLIQVQQNGSTTASYTYDSNGNRLTGSGLGSAPIYDDQDRLIQYGPNSYTYTANGELTIKTVGTNTTTYTYDELGNLTRGVLPGGTQIDYLIDGQHRRIGKKVGGVLTQGYLYDGQLRIVAELDGVGTLMSRFVYGSRVNVPDYMIKGGVTYRIVSDHLGSPRLVVDVATGAVAQQLAYDEFGNVLSDSNPGFQPFGFAGGLYDPDTGLVRFGARDYDAVTGRWTAKDPIRFGGGDTNMYAYVGANPINRVDPLGLYWFRQSWQTPGVVGRRDTPVPPRGPVSEFIEQYVPAGYTFGEMHDTFVDAATSAGIPGWLANIPSMIPMYGGALGKEVLRAFGILEQPTPPNFVQMNALDYTIARASITFTLFAVIGAIFCGPSYAEELQPGNRYKIIRPVYLVAEYYSLNNRQVSRETARAYLESMLTYKKSWVAFQCEVPVGTIMTIIGQAPKVWHLPFFANRYFVRLDPDLSRGLDVILELNRGIEGSLDGLNPELFSRP